MVHEVVLTLSQVVVPIVLSKVGIHEEGGNNRGPEVDPILASVNLPPGYPWCAATVYDIFREGSRQLGIVNPCPRTAKAVKLWQLAEAASRDSNPSVGAIYVLDHGPAGNVLTEWKCNRYGDDGHTGIVCYVNASDAPETFEVPEAVATLLGLPAGTTSVIVPPGNIVEVSGNTNRTGSREGDCVWLKVGPSPEVIHGGMLLGYVQLDRAAQRSALAS